MKKPGNQLLLLIFCIILYGPLKARQQLSLSLNHISTTEGLSSIYVRKIIKDPKGYIWIATQDGLNRFDGRHFMIFRKGNTNGKSITGSDIRDLVIDTAQQLIWSVNSYGGIDAISYITCTVEYQLSQSANKNISRILFSSLALHNETLYIGSSQGLFLLNTKTKKLDQQPLPAETLTRGLPPAVNKVLIDQNNTCWLFLGEKGIYRKPISGKAFLLIPEQKLLRANQSPGISFFDACLLKNGQIITATSHGLKRITTSGLVSNDPFPQIANARGITYSCQEDDAGHLWFSTDRNLIRVKDNPNDFEIITESSSRDDKNWLGAVYTLLHDHSTVWIGCQQGLAFGTSNPSPFYRVNYSAQSLTAIKHAYYIYPESDSIIYVCGENGFYKVSNRSQVKAMDEGKPYFHLFPFGSDKLIVSNTEGSFVYAENKLVPLASVFSEFIPLNNPSFNSYRILSDSILVLGTETEQGIVVWNTRSQKASFINKYSGPLKLADNIVNTIFRDSKGLLWVLSDNAITLIDFANNTSRELATFNKEQKKFYSIFFDVCEARGNFYVCSYGNGVLKFDQNYQFKEEINTSTGLSNNGVYKVLPYRDSLLFITSNHGLNVLHLHSGRIRTYFETGGIHSNGFEEMSGNTGFNKIYAGGSNGFTIVDPRYLKADTGIAPFYIDQISFDTGDEQHDTTHLSLQSLEIPSNVLQTTINFSSLNFTAPFYMNLSYRIKELHENWINLTADPQVRLIGLANGTYTLQLRSANEDGKWSETKELILTFLPKWYQTWWFKALASACLVGIIFLIYRLRMAQLAREEKIRRKLASDLHDDLGSTLNSVKAYANLAMLEKQNDSHLHRIKEGIQDATAAIRDMIWVLDDKKDTVDHLLGRLLQFAEPLCDANGIALEKEIGESAWNHRLRKEEKRNLYMILKETINNSIKYASCSVISITIVESSGKLRILITDNGKGFDTTTVTPGNGIHNITTRSREAGYLVNITSVLDQGTTVELIQN